VFFCICCTDFGGAGAFPPSNLRVLCEHLHLPKAQQVEFKARIIAMIFAVNSTWGRVKSYHTGAFGRPRVVPQRARTVPSPRSHTKTPAKSYQDARGPACRSRARREQIVFWCPELFFIYIYLFYTSVHSPCPSFCVQVCCVYQRAQCFVGFVTLLSIFIPRN
jgi:hypothetical protein